MESRDSIGDVRPRKDFSTRLPCHTIPGLIVNHNDNVKADYWRTPLQPLMHKGVRRIGGGLCAKIINETPEETFGVWMWMVNIVIASRTAGEWSPIQRTPTDYIHTVMTHMPAIH